MLNLDNLSEVQSLIDRGVQLNYEYLGKDEKPYQYPLQHAISRDRYESTLKPIRIGLFMAQNVI